jgi:hypothetical protein
MMLRKEEKKKKKEAAAGNLGGLSGRDLFDLGQARDADAEGDGGDDGFDLSALRTAQEAEETAAEAAAAALDGEGVEGGAAAPTGKGAMKVDENLFAMDLGDMDLALEEMIADEARTARGGPASAPGPPPKVAAAASAAAAGDGGVASGDGVAVDTSLFDADDLAGLDLDGIDDAE